MKNFKFGINIFLFLLIFLPVLVFGDVSVTASPNTGITYECVQIGAGPKDANGKATDVYGNCNFENLVAATKKVTDWGAKFALSFSVVVIAVVGGRYMFYADNASERTKTHEMLWKVLIGIAFILAAWLIVTLITKALLGNAVLQSVPNPS